MSRRPANEIWNYQQIDLGFNYRLSDIHAALGLSQLGRLDSFVEARKRIAHGYDQRLSTFLSDLQCFPRYGDSSHHLYCIRIPASLGRPSQRDVYEYLRANGVAANLHYIPVHRHPFYEKIGFREGDFPYAERWHREAISLPIFPDLTQVEQDHVCDRLSEILV